MLLFILFIVFLVILWVSCLLAIFFLWDLLRTFK